MMTESWDRRMEDYEARCLASEATLKEKHEVEQEALRRRIFGPLEKPKWSTHLLNLRKIQEAVAKQQDYDRAAKIQRQADKLQAQEMRVLEIEALERHEVHATLLYIYIIIILHHYYWRGCHGSLVFERIANLIRCSVLLLQAAAEKLEEKHEKGREVFQDRVAFGLCKRNNQRARNMKNLAQRYTHLKVRGPVRGRCLLGEVHLLLLLLLITGLCIR